MLAFADGLTTGSTREHAEDFTFFFSKKIHNRRSILHSTSRPRRSSLSNMARGFYRQGHENYRSGSNEFSCNLSSKLLHLAWHPTKNFIACASGNSLLMYHA
ncbi:hypothetical protein NC651_033912 [Populus alba x Populus x berolinensis]|nr:hypothetical protein NC651_033912 [Populus alba x Populus x berolinensis]